MGGLFSHKNLDASKGENETHHEKRIGNEEQIYAIIFLLYLYLRIITSLYMFNVCNARHFGISNTPLQLLIHMTKLLVRSLMSLNEALSAQSYITKL